MRLVTTFALLVTAIALLAGCATQRLVPQDDAPAVSLAGRSERAHTETEFLLCASDVEGAYAPIESRGEGEEEEAKNKLILFLGATLEEEGEGFSIGLEYERLIHRKWGVGAFVEYTAGDLRESVAGIGITYHPVERAFVFGGGGIAISREGPERPLLRLGGGYDFPLGRGGLFVAPCAYLDWIELEDAVVIVGVNFGKNW